MYYLKRPNDKYYRKTTKIRKDQNVFLEKFLKNLCRHILLVFQIVLFCAFLVMKICFYVLKKWGFFTMPCFFMLFFLEYCCMRTAPPVIFFFDFVNIGLSRNGVSWLFPNYHHYCHPKFLDSVILGWASRIEVSRSPPITTTPKNCGLCFQSGFWNLVGIYAYRGELWLKQLMIDLKVWLSAACQMTKVFPCVLFIFPCVQQGIMLDP